MAKKQGTPAATKTIGQSDVKSLDGLTFGTKDNLPARAQTIDPARLAAAKDLAQKISDGLVASDGKTFASFKEAHLAGMTYRRLLVLGIARTPGMALKPLLRITQTTDGFVWNLTASAGKPEAEAEAAS